jgi:hypothetical protein
VGCHYQPQVVRVVKGRRRRRRRIYSYSMIL